MNRPGAAAVFSTLNVNRIERAKQLYLGSGLVVPGANAMQADRGPNTARG